VTTELIFHNALHGYDAAEIVSLLSCMVFQEKRASEPVLTEKLVAVRIQFRFS
jgi:antiviral helicase SKI2